jgi:hypothetical protein
MKFKIDELPPSTNQLKYYNSLKQNWIKRNLIKTNKKLVVVNHWVIRIERLYSIINQRVTNSCIYRDLENDKVFLTYLLNF